MDMLDSADMRRCVQEGNKFCSATAELNKWLSQQ